MIIYSVLRECSYDGPHFVLFTSLRKAVNFCESEYQQHLDFINDDEPTEDMQINYKHIKANLVEEEHNSWACSMYNGENFSLEVTKHDSKSPIWYNEQHGGF